ncbi:MAG: acetyltransferase [Syntrophales bacterium]|jgi:sugar O-acyltransferase (sialic acid O-acetyltransferase NeuD family)|nr:acetyltransferase [Syntrophales bacterium]MDY0043765.1 acetyltransferase [Syntrophales bacterium]
MKEKILLIGGGGHCKSCIDVLEQEDKYQIAGIVDVPEKLRHTVLGYRIIGTDEDLPDLRKDFKNYLITFGQIKSAEKRRILFKDVKRLGGILPVIVSPSAYVSRHAKVEEGTIIMHYAFVNAGARIGKNCIINSKAVIEHDAVIGDNCHISTGAVVNGGVNIGNGTFFGSNSVSKEYLTIGNNSVVGCGVTVIRDIPASSIKKS